MCEWGRDTKASVLTPDGLEELSVDSCMKPIVEGLGKAGIATVGCCCGHGKDCPHVLLADGRVVYILNEKPWECWKLIGWAIKRVCRETMCDLRRRLMGILLM